MASIHSRAAAGRCVISDAQLGHLITIAYEIRDPDTIKGGPPWMRDDKFRFNVLAVAPHPESATEEQLLEMMKELLADRFKAKIRVDMKPTQGYPLVVAPGGVKITPSRKDEGLEVNAATALPTRPRFARLAFGWSVEKCLCPRSRWNRPNCRTTTE